MILPNDATVAVADGERLRLFRNKAPEPQVRLVAVETPELTAVNAGSGLRHRSSAANPDDTRQNEDGFAAAAADHLNRQVLAGDVGSIFVIADPRTLGEMRRHYHAELRMKLVGELAKDLAGHGVEAIEAALIKA